MSFGFSEITSKEVTESAEDESRFMSGLRTVATDFGSDPFDYLLPQERIAERPCYPFHDARMLHIDRRLQTLSHSDFTALPFLLGSKDVLVLNNSKVMKARLFGELVSQPPLRSAPVSVKLEVLLVEELGNALWRVMGRPLKKFIPGTLIQFPGGLRAEVVKRDGDYFAHLQFLTDRPEAIFDAGIMPIPPYIRSGQGDSQDERDYQTAYAKYAGSVAAPTAGLHFTPELLQVLKRRGVDIIETTLHVGPASFLSVWSNDRSGSVTFNTPGCEKGHIDFDAIQRLEQARREGKRIIAVGTTVVRLLETVFSNINRRPDSKQNEVSLSFETELFIRPGHRFRMVDAMITNFHQPRSSHLLLVEAFLGRRLLEIAYETALEDGYRFLSYGDGMFIE